MLKYAKIINEETKACDVGTGTNTGFYQSIGMTEQDVEQAWNGSWYLTGYAPEKPVEVKQGEVRAIRNRYLEATDKYMIIDFPITEEERQSYKEYRQYLRDFTNQENWWEQNPKTFDEWNQTTEMEK
jgi:hypothetical protein